MPKFLYDQDEIGQTQHYYNETDNVSWFQGANPSGLTPKGSINYYHANDVLPPLALDVIIVVLNLVVVLNLIVYKEKNEVIDDEKRIQRQILIIKQMR